MDLESQNSKDARVEKLWRKLDTEGKGELDLDGLKQGMIKINHPLKHADVILQDVMRTLDKNGDGKIQYEEFRVFVEQAEHRLFTLFDAIDHDHNGRIDKGELAAAAKTAGITVPKRELEHFFRQVDADKDGVISFDEWRNFLLFLPSERPGLKAVLSYYSSAAVTMNSEGDTLLSDDTVEGLGKKILIFCFGSIMSISSPVKPLPRRLILTSPTTTKTTSPASKQTSTNDIIMEASVHASVVHDIENYHSHEGCYPQTLLVSPCEVKKVTSAPTLLKPWPTSIDAFSPAPTSSTSGVEAIPRKDNVLTRSPTTGFFVAGAVAGAVSRTCTAPLDRLKTYLIANTAKSQLVIKAVAQGEISAAVMHLGRPLAAALRELWGSGGIRSLYSGNGLNVIKVMPESAIRFGSYEAAKRAVARLEGHDNPKNINIFSKFVAGGLAGVVAQACVYPIDTLKFRMQCETVTNGLRGNALVIHTARSMVLNGGMATAYRGLTVGLIGMFPYAAIDFAIMEALKAHCINRQARKQNFPFPLSAESLSKSQPGPIAIALIGACSGSIGATVVYPVNLLRTRLQAQGTVLHPQVYKGFGDVYRKTLEREGWRGLWKGLTPNLLKVVPAVSISYMTYESTKKFIGL